MLGTVTPRDSSRDISLSRLFYLKSFPHFSTFSAHRTSALLRIFPHFSVFHLSLPSLILLWLLSCPYLPLPSVSLPLVSPFLSAPYIGYYVTHFVTQTSVIPYIPVISIYTWTLLVYFSSL